MKGLGLSPIAVLIGVLWGGFRVEQRRGFYEQRLAELDAQASQIKARLTSLDTLIEDPLLGSDILSVLQGEAVNSTRFKRC